MHRLSLTAHRDEGSSWKLLTVVIDDALNIPDCGSKIAVLYRSVNIDDSADVVVRHNRHLVGALHGGNVSEYLRISLTAGFTRFRPVLMTALAMIIGMVPMALGLGDGGEQNAPLGRAVIGGLFCATVATLVFVPSVFALFHNRSQVPPTDSTGTFSVNPLSIAEPNHDTE